MALNKEQLAILKTELEKDLAGLGYTSDDPDCADMLNEVRSGAAYQLPNTSIPARDVKLAVDPDELSNVSGNKFGLFQMLMSGSVDVSENSDMETSIKKIFAGCPNTLAALGALRTIDASRAQILFGAGVTVGFLDVSRARLSGQGY